MAQTGRNRADRENGETMNIRDAKLCPSCDEIYDDDKCPRCGEVGTYLTTWVKPVFPRPVDGMKWNGMGYADC